MRVVAGKHAGESGMVVRVEGPVVTLFTDASRQEIRVFGRDLGEAITVASSVDSCVAAGGAVLLLGCSAAGGAAGGQGAAGAGAAPHAWARPDTCPLP